MGETIIPSSSNLTLPPFYNEPKVASSYITDKFYAASINYTELVSTQMTQHYYYFVPFVPFATHTFQAISFYNAAADDNGTNIRVGIYSDDGEGRPGAILVDAGVAALTGAAAVRTVTISGGQELVKNTIYWPCMVVDSANVEIYQCENAIGNVGLNNPLLPSYGVDAIQLAPNIFTSYVDSSQTYGALAASITAGNLIASSTTPVIYLKG